MASEENLYDSLRAGAIDSAELSEIALRHFDSAKDISPTEVVFGLGADNETFALKFVYKLRQRLVQIIGGPALKAEDINSIKAKIDLELQQSSVVQIAAQVLFTHISVEGWFRYRDAFQIIPVPAGAPVMQPTQLPSITRYETLHDSGLTAGGNFYGRQAGRSFCGPQLLMNRSGKPQDAARPHHMFTRWYGSH